MSVFGGMFFSGFPNGQESLGINKEPVLSEQPTFWVPGTEGMGRAEVELENTALATPTISCRLNAMSQSRKNPTSLLSLPLTP